MTNTPNEPIPNADSVRRLITVQVFVDADPDIAENVASRAADYITESFDDEDNATVQTVLVHAGPFTFTAGGIVQGSVVYDGSGS